MWKRGPPLLAYWRCSRCLFFSKAPVSFQHLLVAILSFLIPHKEGLFLFLFLFSLALGLMGSVVWRMEQGIPACLSNFLTRLCLSIWVSLWGGWCRFLRKHQNREVGFPEQIVSKRKVNYKQMIMLRTFINFQENVSMGHWLAFIIIIIIFNLGLIFSLLSLPVLCLRMGV